MSFFANICVQAVGQRQVGSVLKPQKGGVKMGYLATTTCQFYNTVKRKGCFGSI